MVVDADADMVGVDNVSGDGGDIEGCAEVARLDVAYSPGQAPQVGRATETNVTIGCLRNSRGLGLRGLYRPALDDAAGHAIIDDSGVALHFDKDTVYLVASGQIELEVGALVVVAGLVYE